MPQRRDDRHDWMIRRTQVVLTPGVGAVGYHEPGLLTGGFYDGFLCQLMPCMGDHDVVINFAAVAAPAHLTAVLSTGRGFEVLEDAGIIPQGIGIFVAVMLGDRTDGRPQQRVLDVRMLLVIILHQRAYALRRNIELELVVSGTFLPLELREKIRVELVVTAVPVLCHLPKSRRVSGERFILDRDGSTVLVFNRIAILVCNRDVGQVVCTNRLHSFIQLEGFRTMLIRVHALDQQVRRYRGVRAIRPRRSLHVVLNAQEV